MRLFKIKIYIFYAIVLGMISAFLSVVGCSEYQENKLVKEQAVTFEEELSFRQKKEIELENKLKKAYETINKLEKQLECKKESNK